MQETEQGGFTGGLLLVIFSDLHLYTTKKTTRRGRNFFFFLLFSFLNFFFFFCLNFVQKHFS